MGVFAPVVGIIGSTHQMHAVLIAGEADRGYVLDVRTPYVADMATFSDFRLVVISHPTWD